MEGKRGRLTASPGVGPAAQERRAVLPLHRSIGAAVVGLAALTAPAMADTAGAPHRTPEVAISVARSVDFDSEVIRISVARDTIEVDGLYRFLCHRTGVGDFRVLYPYPEDHRMGAARMVSLEARVPASPWAPIKYQELKGRSGSIWHLPSGLGDTLEVRARYRQALLGPYARYIVTTTRRWGRPLRSARFEIRLPRQAQPLRFSHPFQRIATHEGGYYLFEATDFMPDRDIEVEWGGADLRR
jgi:hypothetical protein